MYALNFALTSCCSTSPRLSCWTRSDFVGQFAKHVMFDKDEKKGTKAKQALATALQLQQLCRLSEHTSYG